MSEMQEYTSDRAARTHDAMISAGFDLMLDRPIEDIPIDDLVTAAGVGKGSFFNHFGDKDGFKKALAVQVRTEMEQQVTEANSGEENPLERIAGGMREVTDYVLKNRRRATVVLRLSTGATKPDYSLNDGLRKDIEDCVKAKLVRKGLDQTGILYWLGLCVALMTYVAENRCERHEAATVLHQFLIMGLCGLGVHEAEAQDIAGRSKRRLEALMPSE